MTMAYIRDYYRVPAKRGGRIRFRGFRSDQPREGTIVGSRDAHLRVRFDDSNAGILSLHPTWMVEYLDAPAAAADQPKENHA